MNRQQIQDVREAFRIIFHEGLPLPAALDRLEEELAAKPAVEEMIRFLRQCHRGINSRRILRKPPKRRLAAIEG